MAQANDWRRVAVSEVCESIIDCVNKTAPVFDEPTPFKMIRTTNVRGGWINLDEAKCVTEEVFARWTRRQLPRRGDVILTREAPLGEVGMLRSEESVFLGQRLVSYRVDPAKLDNRFLLYAFQERDLQGQIKALGSGATVEHMRVPDAEKLILRLPPLPIQRRIADVLATYDDLIENNGKRIRILEDMARSLCREWFVEFRFPGHDRARFLASQIGRVPADWAVGRLDEHVVVHRGKSYKGTELVEDGGVPFVNLKCFVRDGGFRRDGIKRFAGEAKAHQHVRAGDIVMAVTDMTQERRIIARAARVPRMTEPVAVFSMDVVKIEPRMAQKTNFLYAMLRYSQFADEVKKHANGANVLHLNPDRIESFVTVVPPTPLAVRFGTMIDAMLHQQDVLALKNDALREARDLLLPRLASGEIELPT